MASVTGNQMVAGYYFCNTEVIVCIYICRTSIVSPEIADNIQFYRCFYIIKQNTKVNDMMNDKLPPLI